MHTCHILPPFEIDLGLFLAAFAGSGGKYYFRELAERVEYGNYEMGKHFSNMYVYMYAYIYIYIVYISIYVYIYIYVYIVHIYI